MKKRKKKRGGGKRKLTPEQIAAHVAVNEWVSLSAPTAAATATASAFEPAAADDLKNKKFELHSHSICSDGFLSPSKLVERAHANGVKVLALTDHDTFSGISEAIQAAHRYGIKIIPGVEISTLFSPRLEPGSEEPVHVLAYYGCFGPTRSDELEKFLADIRDGRFSRARSMITKLNELNLSLKWDQVAKIAGVGVAPGRLHIARAMVEAGLVENCKQAFARYLYDGGPAYSTGSEPFADEAVRLICKTGGVAVLAHPWSLKNPVAIIRRLKDAGLHGMEVYRSDGKMSAFSELADANKLLKVGGSDYHGRGGHEGELGSANLPMLAIHDFLKVARPIWYSAILEILTCYAEEPTKLERLLKFGKSWSHHGNAWKDFVDVILSTWLTVEEMCNDEFEALHVKLSGLKVS